MVLRSYANADNKVKMYTPAHASCPITPCMLTSTQCQSGILVVRNHIGHQLLSGIDVNDVAASMPSSCPLVKRIQLKKCTDFDEVDE
jgi:hypothetical protein